MSYLLELLCVCVCCEQRALGVRHADGTTRNTHWYSDRTNRCDCCDLWIIATMKHKAQNEDTTTTTTTTTKNIIKRSIGFELSVNCRLPSGFLSLITKSILNEEHSNDSDLWSFVCRIEDDYQLDSDCIWLPAHWNGMTLERWIIPTSRYGSSGIINRLCSTPKPTQLFLNSTLNVRPLAHFRGETNQQTVRKISEKHIFARAANTNIMIKIFNRSRNQMFHRKRQDILIASHPIQSSTDMIRTRNHFGYFALGLRHTQLSSPIRECCLFVFHEWSDERQLWRFSLQIARNRQHLQNENKTTQPKKN